MRRFATPLGIFILLVVLLGVGLTLDPRRVPSPLIGKPIPAFELSTVRDPEQRFSQDDLSGRVSLLNVWATWCIPCREEHPVLVGIARRGEAVLYGLNYKDDLNEARAWLDKLGDPYEMSGFDRDGRAGIDLGVYGVPETFIIDAEGKILYKHIGPINDKIWREDLYPLVQQAEEKLK
ncbi:MAG: DsbE family thiol:disulfide interchange protein [Gammaproteobacteria bacterium]|nr:DsbE family thiol:disulfide interchange protein [Gammaproteobacteria bacterium]